MIKIILLGLVFVSFLPFTNAQPGQLDSSFGNNGIVINDFGKSTVNSSTERQTLVGSDGSIYVVFETKGSTFITRRASDGALDKNYGKNGFSDPVDVSPRQAAM